MIPAGTVHAIGAGVVLAEIQQMSDATFRVHDWGRVGPDGKPRTLHPAEALESTDFAAGPVDPVAGRREPIAGGTRERLVACPYFALERLRLDGRRDGPAPHRRPPRPVHDPDRPGGRGRGSPRRAAPRGSASARPCSCPPRSGSVEIVPQAGGETVVLTCPVP